MSCERATKIVHAYLVVSESFDEGIPFSAIEVALSDRCAVLSCEHQSVLIESGTLRSQMIEQLLCKLITDRNSALRSIRLERLVERERRLVELPKDPQSRSISIERSSCESECF